MTEISVSGSYSHIFGRDEYHRISTVETEHLSLPGNLMVSDATYLGPGRALASLDLAGGGVSGMTSTVQRNGFGLVTDIETTRLGQANPFLDFEYQWNDRWLLDFEKRGHQSNQGDAYVYDGLGRLQEFYKDSVNPASQLAGGAPQYSYKNTYHMDQDYHRTAVERQDYGAVPVEETYTTSATRHHYDTIDEDGSLGPVPPRTRVQNDDGNLIQDGDRHFIYDAYDRLIRVEDRPAGSVTAVVAEYEYDAIGRRELIKTPSQSIELLYSGSWVLEERDATDPANKVLLATYYHLGTGLDDISMSRRLDIADLDDDGSSSDYVDLYHHRNRLGSIVALTLSDGTIVESYDYDAYGTPTIRDRNGAVVSSNTTPSGNRYLYTGREYDSATGLYDYRARTYDPETGTFLQEDPLGLVDGINPVAYVRGNPVVFNDPTGMYSASEALEDLGNWVERNRDILGQLLTLTPLGDLADLISAATGKDVTGWIENGFQGEMEDLGWWDRTKRAALAAPAIAAGAFNILRKIDKIKDIANKVRMGAICKVTGKGCFTAGALVLMSCGRRMSLDCVSVGHCVAVSSLMAVSTVPLTPQKLYVVDLEVVDDRGRSVFAHLLRDERWVSAAKKGSQIVTESFSGEILRVEYRDAPPIDWRAGLVTGCYRIQYSGSLVSIDGDRPTYWATPDHVVYSMEDASWVRAADVATSALVAKDDLWVYNLEVLGSRSFLILGGAGAVLAHNHYIKRNVDWFDYDTHEAIADKLGVDSRDVTKKIKKFVEDNNIPDKKVNVRSDGRIAGVDNTETPVHGSLFD